METLPVTAGGGLREAGLSVLRATMGSRLRSKWHVVERGQFRVPDAGPVIFASNHIGWLDGPLMIAATPRPAHALVKAESFRGFQGWLLRFAGQIKVRRGQTDAGALRDAVRALRAGQCVVIFPEGTRGDGELRVVHPGVGYLALVTGAPVVPVAIFGTRGRGEQSEARPAKGATVEVMYGEPLRLQSAPWPRTSAHVREATDVIADHLRHHVAEAKQHSRIGLPGPLPGGDSDG